MQSTVPAHPPNPIFGILSWGFAFLAIYVFVKIATKGVNRYSSCKRTVILGIVVMALITLLESINYRRIWTLVVAAYDVNPLFIWPILFIFGSIFIIIPLADLAIQKYQLGK